MSYVAPHLATRYHRVETCVALLKGGVDAMGRTRRRTTCLDVALTNGHTGRLLRVLTTAEATDDQRRTCREALRYAVYANKRQTFRELVALGDDMRN